MEHFSAPLYRLMEESTGALFLTSRGIEGFFVESDHDGSGDVVLRGVTDSRVRPGQTLPDVQLGVVDHHGNMIGSYYIGDVVIVVEIEADNSAEEQSWRVSFDGYSMPYPYAEEIWRRWASGVPLRRGEWMDRPVATHASWLHVVQVAWAEKDLDTRRYGAGYRVTADGRRIVSEASFFCEIGESMNGISGYFGSNLDAFEDCLRTSTTDIRPRELVWKHSAFSSRHLDVGFVREVGSILREYGAEVTFA